MRENKECNGKKKKKVWEGRRGAPAKSFPDGNNWNRTLFKNDRKEEGERRERERKKGERSKTLESKVVISQNTGVLSFPSLNN